MKTKNEHEVVSRIPRQGLVLVGLLATALTCAGISPAQTTTTSAAILSAKPGVVLTSVTSALAAIEPASSSTKPPSQGSHEATTVHGYWTIEVRNPDGKVATHLEFENQICTTFVDPASSETVPGGDSTLSSLLAGTASPGGWSIILGIQEPPAGGQTTTSPCATAPLFSLSQSGIQNATGLTNLSVPFALTCSITCFPVLTASTSPSGGLAVNLSGQFAVPVGTPSTTITAVSTDLFTCGGSPNAPRPADRS